LYPFCATSWRCITPHFATHRCWWCLATPRAFFALPPASLSQFPSGFPDDAVCYRHGQRCGVAAARLPPGPAYLSAGHERAANRHAIRQAFCPRLSGPPATFCIARRVATMGSLLYCLQRTIRSARGCVPGDDGLAFAFSATSFASTPPVAACRRHRHLLPADKKKKKKTFAGCLMT